MLPTKDLPSVLHQTFKMSHKLLLYISLFSIIATCHSQVTFVLNKIPKTTAEKAIYITGNFDGWSGGKTYQLEKNDSALFSVTLPRFSFPLEFKFTCGNWELVETNEQGEDIDNRTYLFQKERDTVFIEIQGWKNGNQRPKETKTDNVILLAEGLANDPSGLIGRKIWAYLPPDYNKSDKTYPVIYMHDGQNLFDASTSYAGEWGVDELMNELYQSDQLEVIVIGIDNGGEKRIEEYTPWENKKYGGGNADAYVNFIISEVFPTAEKQLRIKKGPENTAILGSSLGGLVSYYIGLTRPDVFGKIGVFSPSFWYSEEVDPFTLSKGNIKDQKMYLMASYQEDPEGKTVKDTETTINNLVISGYPETNIKTKFLQEGNHNEKLWKQEFKDAILWLFNN